MDGCDVVCFIAEDDAAVPSDEGGEGEKEANVGPESGED